MSLIDDLKKFYQGKKVLVVGLGIQGGGVGVAKFFTELGSKVVVTDKKNKDQLFSSIEKLKKYPIIFHLGGHQLDDFLKADIIFKNPAVPWSLPELIEAKKKNIPIKMEMSFTAKYFPGKIIGITGTRGKSTTTNLIYQVLKNNGYKVFLGGGLPGTSNLEFLKTADQDTWLVAELSSWALSGFHEEKISPHISVFTNFYPDHLNYYKNMNDYLFDKKAIYLYQKKTDYLIINYRFKDILKNDLINSKIFTFKKEDVKINFSNLNGDHNRENIAAVLKLAKILNLNKNQTYKAISNFNNLPFRQQVVLKKKNIIFINDTTSTTPTATIYALKRFSDKPIVLILGGNSKKLPFDDLIVQLKKSSVKKIILLDGSFTKEILPKLKENFKDKLTDKIYDSLKEAVEKAYSEAKNNIGEVYILFSPAATSFAMFNNEFHRGEEFNKVIDNL